MADVYKSEVERALGREQDALGTWQRLADEYAAVRATVSELPQAMSHPVMVVR